MFKIQTYCDKCKKSDKEKKVVEIRYIEINTDRNLTDKVYYDKDPHLCKSCYKEFKKNMEKLLIDTFGYIE